jgi:hypothetical protein
MKKVKPRVPIVMLTDHLELTEGTLKSVDALVTKSLTVLTSCGRLFTSF